jgi:hypothetical protein
MKILHFNKANNLDKLHNELLEAIPSIRPVADINGRYIALATLQGLGDDIYITVPDETNEAEIQAVINAHDPTPIPPGLEAFIVSTDKTQIEANNIDMATVTITLQPPGTEIPTVDILVDACPVDEIDVSGDEAVFQFRTADPGKYFVEVVFGQIKNYLLIKAI